MGARASRPCRIYEGGMEIERYSSSHEDWSGWAGLHPLSKADAVCAVPPRVPCLRMHQTGSRGGAEARRWEAQRKRASRATRQPPPGVNVSEDCERVEAPAGLPACAGATLLVRAEALPERVEAPAGLPPARARRCSCGLKPSLSAWKPLRGCLPARAIPPNC